ncbi:MAG TPA: DMT family transporter [Candidatus Levybacteria bacterium]|nr:DMT family transporter [Candidatus Levybacteria bacterium]
MSAHSARPYLYLFVATLIWGATIPIMKYALDYIPVFVLAFLRFGIATLIVFPFVKKHLKIKQEHIWLFILSATLGIFVHISLFFFGLTYTTALNTGVLISTSPLFMMVAAGFFLKEKITNRMIYGGIIGFLGILTIMLKDMNGSLQVSPLGDFLIIGSTLTLVFSEIINKKLFKFYSPFVVTFYIFLIGSIAFSPFAGQFFSQNPQFFTTLPLSAILALLFGIMFSSFLAYVLWQKGLSQVDASRAGFFVYMDPIITTVLAVLLLHEIITLPFIIGTLLIFGGILMAYGHIPHPGHHYIKERKKNTS